MGNTLYTYMNLKELKKMIKKENRKIMTLSGFENYQVDLYTSITIDITNAILDMNNGFLKRSYLENKMKEILENCYDIKIIVKYSYVNYVMECFLDIFDDIENISKVKAKRINTILYTYNYISNIDLDDKVKIISINQEMFYNTEKIYNKYIDITNMIITIKSQESILFNFENYILNIINKMKSSKIIINNKFTNDALKYFSLIFTKIEKLKDKNIDIKDNTNIKYIVDLNINEMNIVEKKFNDNLIGHNSFKSALINKLQNFIILNKINVKKIFSIFIFGKSGIGKTEVARLLSECIRENPTFIKINFGNYSSQNSLNSLIGSPRGFVGSESGELSIKLNNSNVGLILFDEFEKADSEIFNFFLELLEDGKFTDSQSKEYDLNKYIIVFTSNIENESQYNKIIPNSLTTRFDMIFNFDLPQREDKEAFIELICNSLIKEDNLKTLQIDKINDEDIQKLKKYEYDDIYSLRDIKLKLENKFIDIIKSYIKY